MENKEIIRVSEINELSGENSKVYLMSDGSQQAVFYPTAETQNAGIALLSADESVDSSNLQASGNIITTYGFDGETIVSDESEESVGTHTVGIAYDENENRTVNRMYMTLSLPTLPRNPRIKKVELCIPQIGIESSSNPKIALHQLNADPVLGEAAPSFVTGITDFDKMSPDATEYKFDITRLFDNTLHQTISFVLKLVDETVSTPENVTLGGSGSTVVPTVCVTYESSYAVGASYRTHTHELGIFGKGMVDLALRNLMFEFEDFAWAGNRMPVTVKHLYNSAISDCYYTNNFDIRLRTANFSNMKIGKGWKLNLMQSMVSASFQHDGEMYSGFVYVGENGEEVFFKRSETSAERQDGTTYLPFEDVSDMGMSYDSENRKMTWGDETYAFDTNGKLVSITNEHNACMSITYTSHKLSSVTDGAGRSFVFNYDDHGALTRITAPDGSFVNYEYTNFYLTKITRSDNRSLTITYSDEGKPTRVALKDRNGTTVYAVQYTYSGDCVKTVKDIGYKNGTGTVGSTSTYVDESKPYRMKVTTTTPADTEDGETEDESITTVYSFDDDGNVVGEYMYTEETGNLSVEGTGTSVNPCLNASNLGATNIKNLIFNSSFDENGGFEAGYGLQIDNYQTEYAKFGDNVLRLEGSSADGEKISRRLTSNLPAGEYTLSVYARVMSEFSGDNCGAYIQVCDEYETQVIAESDHLTEVEGDYVRLVLPFTLASTQTITVKHCIKGKGVAYFDGTQLENRPYVSPYNMIEDCSVSLASNLDAEKTHVQRIYVKSAATTRETFTLSAWAKGYPVPVRDDRNIEENEKPKFCVRAQIVYGDDTTEEFTAEFLSGTREWQLASVEFSKSECKPVKYIDIICDYSHNWSTAEFDFIQLVRNSIETDLSPSDFANDGDEVEDTVFNETDEVIEDEGFPEFEEYTNENGDAITETTFADGEFGTIYGSSYYSLDGHFDLESQTDSRGNTTFYDVDKVTSRNECVTDRCGNKTEYEYDADGKTTRVTSKNSQNTELATVSYSYDCFDQMTEIVRGDGMKYVLEYNTMHNLESIGVNGKAEKLISYSYKNANGKLKQMTYANGDTMKAAYNSYGQMISEKWFNSASALTAHYKYLYDSQGNITRTIDILGKKEYTYYYEDGTLIRSIECDITLDQNEFVISKTAVVTVFYSYDEDGILIRKKVSPALADEYTLYFETLESGETVVKTNFAVAGTVLHSKTDNFGRKVFDELHCSVGNVSRQFRYLEGEITNEHKNFDKIKSTPTTTLVKDILFSDGRTISYEYDEEERITKVTDSVDGVTEYTYDALGQLLTETVNGQLKTTMTYDNYGNISSKNGVVYTYGDTAWKDLLTGVGTQTISYDAQGNPVSYLGHTLTWEKGRQLKSFDNISYTYNANGIRTSKTINGLTAKFILEGTKIVAEVCPENYVLQPMYDNEEDVCGIIYNGAPYYFLKNLQGDVIAITRPSGEVIARYTYDAWGVPTITQDNEGIAAVNPFRYRSYYYDTETGLYYLQSRYYDPTVGRFINSDEASYVMFDTMILKENLFSYCLNNVLNYHDKDGKDAIWLQASESVFGMGHTGLLFEYRGYWYYWYWGLNIYSAVYRYLRTFFYLHIICSYNILETMLPVASTTVFAECMLKRVCKEKAIQKNNYKKTAISKANQLYDSKTPFDNVFYINGNFELCYVYFSLRWISRNYNLLRLNCMQTTVDGLCHGIFKKNNILNRVRMQTARNMIVPNLAYNYLKKFF